MRSSNECYSPHPNVAESAETATYKEPARGEWCVNREEINVLADASSLVFGVLLEKDRPVLEDACWLWPANNAQHINLAELDTVVKGISLALQWQAKRLHQHIGSLCVYHWVSDTLTGKARLCTKATSEMLIKWRLNTLKIKNTGHVLKRC